MKTRTLGFLMFVFVWSAAFFSWSLPAAETSTTGTETTTAAPAAAPEAPAPGFHVDPIQLQKALAKAGYFHGKVDGIIGKRTRTAVRAFQQANGLHVDGRVGPMTWEKLKSFAEESAVPSQAAPAQSQPAEDQSVPAEGPAKPAS